MPDPITQIVIAIIGTAGVIGAAWLTSRNKSAKVDTIADEQPRPIARETIHEARPNLPERQETTNPMIARTEAELSKIANSITATPPFSREHVQEQYRGQSVTWLVELSSVEPLGEGVQATVHAGISTIYCNASMENGAILKTAHEGDMFVVSGTILNVLTKLVIFVGDCTFTEYKEAQQGAAQQRC